MFLLPIIKAKGAQHKDTHDRLNAIKGSMSVTRKVLRFYKPITCLLNLINRLSENEKKPVRMLLCKLLGQISYFFYFLTDHPLYFHKVGFVKYTKDAVDRIDYINNVFWLLGAIFDIFVDTVELQYVQKQIQ